MSSRPENDISLRKFPYPYQAMFAISSDLDHAVSLPAYLEFMKYLNTDQNTCYGKGLGLEISNSFWFFNAEEDRQLSYFQGLSSRESDFAPVCRALWASGHLDTLHSYGNFNPGGFERSFAEKALEELAKHGADIPVWVNHGNDNNHQNIGNFTFSPGGNPASKDYHFDLLKESGSRFFWAGRTTHVSGQSASFSLENRLQQQVQNLVVKLKYGKINRPLPDPQNRLIVPSTLEDGHSFLDFQRFISRFGEVNNTDLHDLTRQLTRGNLDSLINSKGYMLLYTHMNENLPEGQALPPDVEQGFKLLVDYARKKDLMVTTAARLLQYADLTENLNLEVQQKSSLTEIHLTPKADCPIRAKNLQGVTVYCSEPARTTLYYDGLPLAVEVNPPDQSGLGSVSVPWDKLEYPL